jgi:hypothetical protein
MLPTFGEMARTIGVENRPADATPGCECLYCATGMYWCSQRPQSIHIPTPLKDSDLDILLYGKGSKEKNMENEVSD